MIKPGAHILITGGAGFIGSHLTESLLKHNYKITIIDNLDDFYNPEIKKKNIEAFHKQSNFSFIQDDVRNISTNSNLKLPVDAIIHLAAKAGVRQSTENPEAHYKANTEALREVLTFAERHNVPRFIFTSSSSVYGNHPSRPWHEKLEPLQPLSPYARSKLACETMGKAYAEKTGNPFIALRLFSVYGPRMRPDLAMCLFTDNILQRKKLKIFGDGTTFRDYTYVKDIVNGIKTCLDVGIQGFEIINLAGGKPVGLDEMISTLQNQLGSRSSKRYLAAHEAESEGTLADVQKAKEILDFEAKTDFETGVKEFCKWYTREKHQS